MVEQVLNQVRRIVGTYFDESEVNLLIKELDTWDIAEDCFFCQVIQEGDEPKAEIAFRSGKFLVDLTYHNSTKEICAVPLTSIINLRFTDSGKETHVEVHTASAAGLIYTAAVEKYRQSLRDFWGGLKQVL